MDSITSKIEQRIKSLKRGTIFFPDDFIDLGSADAVRQTLTRLHNEGMIIRVAQGVYCYPEIEDKLGLGVLYPSFEQIAVAVAKRDHARIVPTGAYALNLLGLSTQVPLNYVFLTDGSERNISISNGRKIVFKNTTPKNLAFQNRLAMLITFALKSLKKENVEDRHIERIYELLQNEPKEAIMPDLRLMPAWIRKIVKNAYK
ncbi:MAG TPA: DUF6088 family protein [Salinivirgaceae bacterium]|nr:DUF6088 family protein [Salinivirgaceae bacterium]